MYTKTELKKHILSLKFFKNFINSKPELFSPYKFQNKIINALDSKENLLINSARQMGVSTMLRYFMIFKCLKHNNYKIIYVTHDKMCQQIFLDFLRNLAHSYCEEAIDFATDTRTSISFKNGSNIKVINAQVSAGKAERLDLIIFDNAAFIKGFESIYLSSLMVSERLIICSSPFKNSFFNKLCSVKKSFFKKIKLPWHIHDINGANKIINPHYDLKHGDASKYTNEYYVKMSFLLHGLEHINEEFNCVIVNSKKNKTP